VTTAGLVAFVLLLAMTAYACGGGTDYGAGFWDLVAGGRDRGERPRALIDYAMAPVWEANNVWLIFVLVLLWTGFPVVLAAVFSSVWIALVLGVLGLVLRGAGFAFRKPTRLLARRRRYGAVFGIASILTPFFFAAAVGGVASGRVQAGVRGDEVTSWLNPTSLTFGVLTLVATAFIAAVFLQQDAHRFGAPELVEYFRLRALGSAFAMLLAGIGGIIVLRFDARYIYDGLLRGWGLVFVVVALVAAAATVSLVWAGVGRGVRVTAVVTVGSTVFAWGMAQAPYLLPTTLTIEQAAGNPNSLRWLLLVSLVALVLVVPTLILLLWLDTRGRLVSHHEPADEDTHH
jgi:cytochrome d ubiquinol oxidase subunit II